MLGQVYLNDKELTIICGNCNFKCGNCKFKSEKHDMSDFRDLNIEDLANIIISNNIQEIKVMGQDPMYCTNRTALIDLFKQLPANINITLYTKVSKNLLTSRQIVLNRMSKYVRIVFLT